MLGWGWWLLLAGLSLILFAVHRLKHQSKETHDKVSRSAYCPSKEFYAFQKEYLTVYALVIFADWLQGTNMYLLYQVRGI